MRRAAFRYSNPFSSIDVRAANAEHMWLEWTAEAIAQGFCLSDYAVSFSTSDDDDYEVTVLESEAELVPDDCVFAVTVPLDSRGLVVHIRGGYSDVDVALTRPCRSVTFMELSGHRVVLLLGQELVSEVRARRAASETP